MFMHHTEQNCTGNAHKKRQGTEFSVLSLLLLTPWPTGLALPPLTPLGPSAPRSALELYDSLRDKHQQHGNGSNMPNRHV